MRHLERLAPQREPEHQERAYHQVGMLSASAAVFSRRWYPTATIMANKKMIILVSMVTPHACMHLRFDNACNHLRPDNHRQRRVLVVCACILFSILPALLVNQERALALFALVKAVQLIGVFALPSQAHSNSTITRQSRGAVSAGRQRFDE
jgi:hypothetical protein